MQRIYKTVFFMTALLLVCRTNIDFSPLRSNMHPLFITGVYLC